MDRRERRLAASSHAILEAIGDGLAEHGDRLLHQSSASSLERVGVELGRPFPDEPGVLRGDSGQFVNTASPVTASRRPGAAGWPIDQIGIVLEWWGR
jgi:hypothetical protein